jgi:hypothetical protein
MVAGVFENNFLTGVVQVSIFLWMGMALHAGLRVRRRLTAPG